MTKGRWMVAGDVNQGIEPMRRLLDAPHSFGREPMGAFWGTGFAAKTSTRTYKGADHKILEITSGETKIAVVNCTWQWGGDDELLNKIAEWADIMLMVEGRTAENRPLPIRKFIGDTHRVRQDLSNSSRSGSAIAVRKSPDLHIRSSKLTRLSPEGHNVQARFLRELTVVDHGVPSRYAAGHLGLQSTGVQDNGERNMKNWVARARRAS